MIVDPKLYRIGAADFRSFFFPERIPEFQSVSVGSFHTPNHLAILIISGFDNSDDIHYDDFHSDDFHPDDFKSRILPNSDSINLPIAARLMSLRFSNYKKW